MNINTTNSTSRKKIYELTVTIKHDEMWIEKLTDTHYITRTLNDNGMCEQIAFVNYKDISKIVLDIVKYENKCRIIFITNHSEKWVYGNYIELCK